ncbi:MAG: hypothetical protein NZ891_00640, partial [bacterium]|nr:hypothetical protein [bacterium]MDW8163239.1 hypothetical protein [Candidatus Omnitrophota bacterium]
KYWKFKIEIEEKKEGEKPQIIKAYLWVPEDCQVIRGLILTGGISIEDNLSRNEKLREFLKKENFGIVKIKRMFLLKTDEEKEKFEKILIELGEKSSHPEIINLPFITIGHSTGGIYARNIGYFYPEKTLGIIHIKSGNLQAYIPNPGFSLSGIPFLAVNGEFEEYGPDGGGKGGLREKYGKQTQWIMIRKQLLYLRQKDANLLFSLLVHPGGSHTSWDEEMTDYVLKFIQKCIIYRYPEKFNPLKDNLKCKKIDVKTGYLTDANIKYPKFPPSPFLEYKGDKDKTFWHFDKEMAELTFEIHKKLTKDDPSQDEKWWEIEEEILIPKFLWIKEGK